MLTFINWCLQGRYHWRWNSIRHLWSLSSDAFAWCLTYSG